MKITSLMLSVLGVLLVAGLVFAGGDIQRGKALFDDPSLGTNGKSCSSCHPEGRGINGQKESFTIMGKKQATIEDAINFCIQNALKGQALSKDSPKMKDLAAYLKTLKGEKRKRKRIKGC